MLVPAGCTVTLLGSAPGVGGSGVLIGYVSTLLGLLSCAIVYGLWTLQAWGRSFASWLYLASIPLGVVFIFPPLAGPRMTAGNTIFQMVSIAVDLFIVAYLSRPDVKALFGAPQMSAGSLSEGRQEPM